MTWDVVVVGSGPAGLSAALVLGRCRRAIIVVDNGEPRNRFATSIHGYLTRDGIGPQEFLRIAREQLVPYDIQFRNELAVNAVAVPGGFEVELRSGERLRSRTLLLATGVVDRVPEVEGMRERYGTSVHHCPYCDGWEARDKPIAVYGQGRPGASLGLSMKTWSADVVLCTDGPAGLTREHADILKRADIPVRTEKIARLEGPDRRLERIVFENGPALERTTLFFASRQEQHSDIAARLGCQFNEKGTVRTDRWQATNIPGLYVAGDAARDVQSVIVAAAEGAKAAMAINTALQRSQFSLKSGTQG